MFAEGEIVHAGVAVAYVAVAVTSVDAPEAVRTYLVAAAPVVALAAIGEVTATVYLASRFAPIFTIAFAGASLSVPVPAAGATSTRKYSPSSPDAA